MNALENYNRVAALLRDAPMYVWVLEYGITHHRMRLAVHNGDYPRYTEIYCIDCSSFSGPLQGGPYALRLASENIDKVETVSLIGNDGQLRIVCGSVSIGQVDPLRVDQLR